MSMNESDHKTEKKSWKFIFLYIVIGLTLAFGGRMIVEPTIVIGQSMDPTFHEGQYLINSKVSYLFSKPKHGDVVIVEPKNKELDVSYLIKRVIAVPGDKIEIKNNQLFLNDKKQKEPYIAEKMKDNEDFKITLKENQVFVMGDNRNDSLDSRVIGPVDYKKEVRGHIVFRVMPMNQDYKTKHAMDVN